MCRWIRIAFFLAATFFAFDAVSAAKLPHKTNSPVYGGYNRIDIRGEGGNPWINTVRGLFNSNKGDIPKYISEIPCNIIQTLETDAGQAEQFVTQIRNGQVPSILSDLPQEAVNAFGDVLNILASLPTEIINVAEAVATAVETIVDDIEDGQITAVIAALPSEVVAGLTNGWGDLTDGITDAWNGFTCIFAHCSAAGNTCGSPGAAATTTTAGDPYTTFTPASAYASATAGSGAQFTSPQALNTGSDSGGGFTDTAPPPSFRGRGLRALVIAAACVFGIALWL